MRRKPTAAKAKGGAKQPRTRSDTSLASKKPDWWALRAAIGPGIIFVGWGTIMPISFPLGAAIACIGFVVLILECTYDHVCLAISHLGQISIICCVIILFGIFSVHVVLFSAPLQYDCYPIMSGDYPRGDITWNNHLTELRVAITNPSDMDYEKLDIAIKPDNWIYRATILEQGTGCSLQDMGGEVIQIVRSAKGGTTKITTHREGSKFDTEDKEGDNFEPFLSRVGYRLICGSLPAHFTIRIAVALAAPSPRLLGIFPPKNDAAGMGLGVAEIANTNDPFDLLEVKPTPNRLIIDGYYVSRMRKFRTYEDMSLKD